MNDTLLKVKDLSVKLDGDSIIENLSFEIEKGEILTILGPNGAGKSVLIKTILGLLPHVHGSVNWSKKVKISYLPQGLNQLRARGLPLIIYDFFTLKDPTPSRKKIIEFLELVGLDKDILKKETSYLSGGEFQRVLIAWALISEPEMIFLDEPTSGVDLGGGKTIYTLLDSIRNEKKLTIILVTHDLNIVSKYSDNVLCLTRRGHLCFGVPDEVLNTENLKELFGSEIKLYKHH